MIYSRNSRALSVSDIYHMFETKVIVDKQEITPPRSFANVRMSIYHHRPERSGSDVRHYVRAKQYQHSQTWHYSENKCVFIERAVLFNQCANIIFYQYLSKRDRYSFLTSRLPDFVNLPTNEYVVNRPDSMMNGSV